MSPGSSAKMPKSAEQVGKPIRVLIYNPHTLFREGIKALLQGTRINIVGEARTGRHVADLARQLLPDVVLMDSSTTDLTGSEATRRIKAVSPKTKILIVSLNDDEILASGCLRAGASGWIEKTSQPGRLRSLIGAA